MYFGHLAHGNLFHVDLSKIKKKEDVSQGLGVIIQLQEWQWSQKKQRCMSSTLVLGTLPGLNKVGNTVKTIFFKLQLFKFAQIWLNPSYKFKLSMHFISLGWMNSGVQIQYIKIWKSESN